mmetsp:Transcript_28913/g.81428  ORF Transcript_28913/g.81428 Transcript_28913/m.81428 type:complete len:247 (+) Transcript_28913:569-1309(+)
MGGQGGQLVEQADAVVGLLAQADDASGADADAGLPQCLERVEAVLVLAGLGDLGVVLGAGVQVVVVSRHAGLRQLPRLLLVDHPHGGAHLHAKTAHFAHHLQHPLPLALSNLVGASPGSSHAEPGAARLLRTEGGLVHLVHVHQLGGLDGCLVVAGLAAVPAVLWAAARLDAQQRATLHHGWVVHQPVHSARLVDQLQEGGVEDRRDLFARPVSANSPHRSWEGALPHLHLWFLLWLRSCGGACRR